MKTYIATAFAFGLLLTACNAQSTEGADPVAVEAVEDSGNPCANAGTTLQMNACWEGQVALAEANLEKYTQAAFKTLREYPSENTEPTIAQITASGATFKDYAQKACDAVYQNWADGSISGQMMLECKVDLLQERTHHIWREYLISMEGYAPLAEPQRDAVEYKLDTES